MTRTKFDTVQDRIAPRPTRFPELAYRRDAPHIWRIVATEDGRPVGRPYFTRAELLADLDRHARDYGVNP
jgi:hypothetical protein